MDMTHAINGLTEKLQEWLSSLGGMLPNLLVAAVLLVAFWFAARLAQRGMASLLTRAKANRAATELMATMVRIAVLVTGLMVALGVLNLDKALASILAGAGVVGLALGFAFQDLAANLISGVGLAVNRDKPFKIGDIVETNDEFGKVTDIDLRTSTLQTLDGKVVVIPNKQIYQNKVINHSAVGCRRVDLECGVSYGDDLEKVERVATEAISQPDRRNTERGCEVLFSGFGGSSIDFVARFWVEYKTELEFRKAKSDAVKAVKAAFDENNITIPFPIRTLDFGIRGGATLTDALNGLEDSPQAEPNGQSRAAN